MIPGRVPIIVGFTSTVHVSINHCERIDNPMILLNDHWHVRGNVGNLSPVNIRNILDGDFLFDLFG